MMPLIPDLIISLSTSTEMSKLLWLNGSISKTPGSEEIIMKIILSQTESLKEDSITLIPIEVMNWNSVKSGRKFRRMIFSGMSIKGYTGKQIQMKMNIWLTKRFENISSRTTQAWMIQSMILERKSSIRSWTSGKMMKESKILRDGLVITKWRKEISKN
jgi:hypothetical protein